MKKNLIRIVVPGDGDYLANNPGGSQWKKPLRPVDDDLRNELALQIETVEQAFEEAFARWKVPGVAVVRLHDKAIAKTKRPSAYLNGNTCPVIGYGGIGELHVKVTPTRLAALKHRILTMKDEKGTAHISAIQEITPYRAESTLPTNIDQPLRLMLFRHRTQAENFKILQAVRKISGSNAVSEANYADSIAMYRVNPTAPDAVAALQSFIGTKSIGVFPIYSVADAVAIKGGDDKWECEPPDPEKVYAVVGQFDSGISPEAKCLQPWISARHSWYPQSDQQNMHGTFVGGLHCNAHNFNFRDPRFPDCQARIVDSVVFDKSGEVAEDVLLDIIDDALATHPEVRVWNLSLAQPDVICSESGFSPLAIALDYRSRKHDVLFVVTGGNLPKGVPPRRWPSDHRYGPDERNCAPSDVVRGLPVGGIVHRESKSTIAKVGDPSPIVRKGPGAAYNLSPLIAGYPGNCDANGDFAGCGVRSVDENGNLTESLGISFGIPPVSSLAARGESRNQPLTRAKIALPYGRRFSICHGGLRNGDGSAETGTSRGLVHHCGRVASGTTACFLRTPEPNSVGA